MNDVEKYEAIEALFEKHLRPALMSDGGNIELDLVKGDEVIVSFQGACGSCPSSAGATLQGIERAIQQNVFPTATVIPTNAYGMKEVEEEMDSRFGTTHPFGGETYAEQVAKRTRTSPLEGRDLYKSTPGPRDSMGNEDGYTHKPTHVPNAKGRPWPKEMGKSIPSVDSRLDGL
jgi:Fe-S cluster biogenesis protein NfuA